MYIRKNRESVGASQPNRNKYLVVLFEISLRFTKSSLETRVWRTERVPFTGSRWGHFKCVKFRASAMGAGAYYFNIAVGHRSMNAYNFACIFYGRKSGRGAVRYTKKCTPFFRGENTPTSPERKRSNCKVVCQIFSVPLWGNSVRES